MFRYRLEQVRGNRPVGPDDEGFDRHTRKQLHAAKLGKRDGFVEWTQTAAQVHAQIRGVTPKPGARTVLHLAAAGDFAAQTLPLIVSPGTVGEATAGEEPGTLRHDSRGLGVACADRWYMLGMVRPEGRKDMAVKAK